MRLVPGVLALTLIVGLSINVAAVTALEPVAAVGESWPSSNESDGCVGLYASTPLATKIGFLSYGERIRGPYGDMFGRSVADVRADLVSWRIPGGEVIQVHERALPAFQQVTANLAAESAKGNTYAISDPYTWGYAARTVSNSYGISRHTFGISVDINSHTNPYQAGPFEEGEDFTSNMPVWFVQAWRDAGFCWGGDWKDFKDPMHFSWQGPGFTPGYGDPKPSYPVTSTATDFTKAAVYDESTFFADKDGAHLIGDVSGDGAPDPIRLFDKNGDVVVQYMSSRGPYAECGGISVTIPDTSLDTREPIVGDFAGYRRAEVGLVDESGDTVSFELVSQREELGDIALVETMIPVRPDQTYVVGDYTWDNAPDIYVIINGGDSTSVEVWDGSSGYTEIAAEFIALFGNTDGWRFSVGDYDLDDLPDLYAFEPAADGAIVHVYTHSGTSETIASVIDVAAGAITVADFDGDGRDDLWQNETGSHLRAWMGSDAIPSTTWFKNPLWECPDEWEPLEFDGLFRDDDTSVFEADIEWLAEAGITLGCNPPENDRFCPNQSVTRGQMAAFLTRALSLPAAESAGFADTVDSEFAGDIDRLAAAEITFGCNADGTLFCPQRPVSRDQMAAFLVRALGFTDRALDPFLDDDGSIFEPDIERLAAANVTRGCNPPTNDLYCPTNSVTRGEMAAFLRRALGG